MAILVIGGDKRFEYLAEYLSKYQKTLRIAQNNDFEVTINNDDIVVLPIPFSRDGITVNAGKNNLNLPLTEIISAKPCKICGGLLSKNFCETLKANNINYFDYYTDEVLTQNNAMLTAQAAISLAISELDTSLHGKKILITGYGRIGKLLAKYLHSLNAEVTITVRRNEVAAQIYTDGFKNIYIHELKHHISNFELIFNTVPAQIFNRDIITCLNENTVYFELASISGISNCFENNIRIVNGSGLPGRYFPKSAAEYIFNALQPNINNI